MHSFYFLVVLLLTFNTIHADEKLKSKVKKDPIAYTDKDVNDLFEEWEVMFSFFFGFNLNILFNNRKMMKIFYLKMNDMIFIYVIQMVKISHLTNH
jgi:hypothetical protein